MDSWKFRENQNILLVKVLYYKLPTNGKQLPLEVRPGFELWSQRWEASVLQLLHYDPLFSFIIHKTIGK